MSEYDRFAKWVRDQRACSEDGLETKIIQIICAVYDQSKGTPAADKKTSDEHKYQMI
jgi:hypothetical protein